MLTWTRSPEGAGGWAGEALRTAEAGFWILLARAALVLLPFHRISRRLGAFHQGAESARGSPEGDAAAEAVRRAIGRAAHRMPFDVVCMPRALAAWQMLARRGIRAQLHFGAHPRVGGGAMRTHVWVTAGEVEVTGFPMAAGLLELGYFTWGPAGEEGAEKKASTSSSDWVRR